MKWSDVKGRPHYMIVYVIGWLLNAALLIAVLGFGLLVIVGSPISPFLGNRIAHMLFVVLAAAVALTMRDANRRLYAIVEMSVGITIAWGFESTRSR